MFLNNFSRLEEVEPRGELYVFKASRARASAAALAGAVVSAGASAGVIVGTHSAFILLLGPIPIGFLLLSLFLVWSQGTLEIHPSSRRLRLRGRSLLGEKIREWRFEEIGGLVIFGDDSKVGVLQLKLPYGNRVALGRGTRPALKALAARLTELTGICLT